ncbi:MAG: hypothetical protein HPKKFMNG_02490 [Planctomycetes bacterium]|nr:hypothetical protein [Planctomycetota bacterium]
MKVQARGRFVENVERVARIGAGQLGCKLHTLGLAAGECGAGLAELDVAQADVQQCLHNLVDLGVVLKEAGSRGYGHIQYVGDALAPVLHFQRFAVIARAVAGFTHDMNVRQEVHLDQLDALALAGFTPAAGNVEREAAGLVAPLPRLVRLGEEVANEAKHVGVCRGVAAGRAADGRLVNLDDLVDLVEALDALVFTRLGSRAVHVLGQRAGEDVCDQGALAAA